MRRARITQIYEGTNQTQRRHGPPAAEVASWAFPLVSRVGRMLLLNVAQLRAVLDEYQAHYNTARPHQGIAQLSPNDDHDAARATVTDLGADRISRTPVLGGLINKYTYTA